PVIPAALRIIVLTGTDNLVVFGFEVEAILARRRGLPVETGVVVAVLLNRPYTVERALFCLVALTGEQVFAVTRLQTKSKLAAFIFVDLEFPSHVQITPARWGDVRRVDQL